MSPPEFLLASLATCAGYYAVHYLETRGIDPVGVTARVIAEKASQPARLGSFRIEVTVPAVEERHQAALLRAVKTCLVHNTLLVPPILRSSCFPRPRPRLCRSTLNGERDSTIWTVKLKSNWRGNSSPGGRMRLTVLSCISARKSFTIAG